MADGHYPEAGLSAGGHLLAYGSDAAFEKATYNLQTCRAQGIHLETLDATAVAAAYPGLVGRISHGVLVPGSYYGDPQSFVKALAGRFIQGGGRWLKGTVLGFGVKRERVATVETDRGEIETSTVVLAAGAWSRPLVRALGFDTPLDTERGIRGADSRPGG